KKNESLLPATAGASSRFCCETPAVICTSLVNGGDCGSRSITNFSAARPMSPGESEFRYELATYTLPAGSAVATACARFGSDFRIVPLSSTQPTPPSTVTKERPCDSGNTETLVCGKCVVHSKSPSEPKRETKP